MAEQDLSEAPGASEEVAGGTDEQVDLDAKVAELKEALEAANAARAQDKADYERNTRRLQSSLEGRINTERARADSVEAGWEDRYHAEKMATMEAEEALRYENTLLEEKLGKQSSEIEALRQATENARSAAGYIQHFASLGIPVDRLNTSGSLQELADSGYAAERENKERDRQKMAEYAEQVESLTSRVTALAAGEPDPNALATDAGDLEPPNVATHTPGSPSQVVTMDQAQEAAKQWFGGEKPTEEMLFRAVEKGQLPASVLPGLEGMPPAEE